MKHLLITCFFIYVTILASTHSNIVWWKLADTSVSMVDGQAW